jgi:hypothetical protein
MAGRASGQIIGGHSPTLTALRNCVKSC